MDPEAELRAVRLCRTSNNSPLETFDTYGTRTVPVTSSNLYAGSGWSTFGTVNGTFGPLLPVFQYSAASGYNA
jgi:hypothetical protein